MYEEYYGFVEKPFSLTPDPKYLYKSESHAGAFDLLQYAIRRREGFAVITGDIGTGKTTLCRALLEQVDRKTFTALVLNPFLSEDDLLKLILQDFGVISREEMKQGRFARISKQELIDALYDFLLGLLPLQSSAVVIIDEAQNLPLQVLEQIRILSNLETDKEKLLQIVLVGQSNLETLLRSPELRQLDQRISIRYHLKPLSHEETTAYIAHRLTIAGGSRVGFSRKAVAMVHRASGGLPRLINLICDRALLGAYSVRTNRVSPEMVENAIDGLELQTSARPGWARAHRRSLMAGIGTAMAALTLGVAAQFGPMISSHVTGTQPSAGAVSVLTPAPEQTATAAVVPQGDPVLDNVAHDRSASPQTLAPLAANDPHRLPSGSGYTVVVASYSVTAGASAAQVTSLTSRLEKAGFTVYYADVDLAARGRWRRVLVGAFAGLDEARNAEAQLRQAPGLELARAVTFQLASSAPSAPRAAKG